MPTTTKKQRAVKKAFMLSPSDRKMLIELKDLLEMFEFATNEIQTNDVSISRVHPQINSLLIKLVKNIDNYVYTRELKKVKLYFFCLLNIYFYCCLFLLFCI